VEGTRKIGRPRKRWREEVEGDLNIMEIKNWQATSRGRWDRRKIVLDAKVHNKTDYKASGGGGGGG
jgi:hypothetical protein